MDEKKSTPIHTEVTELEVSVEGLIDEAMEARDLSLIHI